MNFEDIKEYLPFIIPLAILQLTLMVTSLVSVFRHKNYKKGNRIVWVILCAVLSIIGPVLYFAIGKEDS